MQAFDGGFLGWDWVLFGVGELGFGVFGIVCVCVWRGWLFIFFVLCFIYVDYCIYLLNNRLTGYMMENGKWSKSSVMPNEKIIEEARLGYGD